MKIILALLLFGCIVQACLSQSYVNKVGVNDEIKYRSSGDGYICSPSHLLDGVKPEANWIWNSGQINPKNYYLYVRKSFSLRNSVHEARAYISASSFAELY